MKDFHILITQKVCVEIAVLLYTSLAVICYYGCTDWDHNVLIK